VNERRSTRYAKLFRLSGRADANGVEHSDFGHAWNCTLRIAGGLGGNFPTEMDLICPLHRLPRGLSLRDDCDPAGAKAQLS